MDIDAIKGEIVAIGLAVAGGIGAVFKMLLNDRRSIEKRLDRLERDTITREEFDEFAREIHAHNGKLRDLIDDNLKAMNGNILWLMHARTSDYPPPNVTKPEPPTVES